MRALVTGATGFIGGRVARALVARGDDVVALVRSPERARGLRELGVSLAGGDITEPHTLAGPMRGVDAVFHLAAWYELGVTDRGAMHRINVRGTEHVLEAARRAEVPRVVHVSSVAALGCREIGDIASETSPHPGRFGSAYEETKWTAHRRALELAADGAPVVVAMPGAVYGPGDTSVIGSLLRMYAKGWLVACPFQDTGFSWVHVDDVADGIVAVFDRGRAGEPYVLGGDNLSLRDLFSALEPLTGVRAPRFDVPEWAVRATIPLSPLLGKALRAGPRVVADGLGSMRGSWMAFSTKAERELGYTYRGVPDAMPETIEWYKES